MSFWDLLAKLIVRLGRPSARATDTALVALSRRLGCAAMILAAGLPVGTLAGAVAVARLLP